VELATFTTGREGCVCTIKTDDARQVAGRFHDPALSLVGKNELGEVNLDLRRIRDMRFTTVLTCVPN